MSKFSFKFSFLLLLSLLLLAALPVSAQGPTLDAVQTNYVDDSQPGQAASFVSVLKEGQVVIGLPPTAFSVYVDGDPLDPNAVQVQPVSPGIAVMVLVDISGSMDEPGVLTSRRLTDAQQLARDFVSGLNSEDWVGVIGFGSDLTPIHDLTYDHGAVLNTIALLPQTAGPRDADQRGFTHLFDAVMAAAERLSNNSDPVVRQETANMRKIIIVLSDGNDTKSSVSRLDAQRLANESRISVYTATLCSAEGEGNTRFACQDDDARWLSAQTSGEALTLGTVANEPEIQSLFQRLNEQRNQYQVDFEWRVAKGVHKCRVEVNSGGKVQSDERECFSLVQPPKISLVSPIQGTHYTRAEAQAATVPVAVALSFPDDAPRNPSKIEYLLNGQPFTTTLNVSFNQPPVAALDLSNLPGGDYTLVAILQDPYTQQRSDSQPLITLSLDPWLPPTITLSIPITKVQTSRGATMTMTIDAAFPDGVPRDVTVTVRDEGVNTIAEATGRAPFIVAWPVDQTRRGEHLIVAEILDSRTGATRRSNAVTTQLKPTALQAIVDWLLHNWYWLLLFLIVLSLLAYLWQRKPQVLSAMSGQIKNMTMRLNLGPAYAKLVTIHGPQKGEYMLRDQISTIGRDQDQCNVVITPMDQAISHTHAVIQRDPRGFFVVKDISTNGTYINNPYSRVQRDPNWTPLNDGDILHMGQSQFQFQVLGKKTQRLPVVP